jgi:beta-glucanase (GH16 family)
MRKIIFICLLIQAEILFPQASCLHSSGVRFLSDAFLGSVGACDCQKDGVIMYNIPKCNDKGYVLEFEENFDGTMLDTSKWQNIPYAQGSAYGSQNLEYSDLNNAEISDGICHVVAKKETVLRRMVDWKDSSEILDDGLPNLRYYNYTACALWSKKRYFHGKFESRQKVPGGNGFWPAFWLYGGKRGNEIDIYDMYKGPGKLITSLAHNYDGTNYAYGCNESFNGFDLTQWHTYTCVFDYDKISFLVDDQLVRVVHRFVTADGHPLNCGDDISTGVYYQQKSYPIEAMNIIVGMGIISSHGPADSKPPDETTPFPGVLEIDYVRIWRRDTAGIELKIHPVPATNSLNATANYDMKSISIESLDGKREELMWVKSKDVRIDISYLPEGMYFLTALFESGPKTVKFVKLKE